MTTFSRIAFAALLSAAFALPAMAQGSSSATNATSGTTAPAAKAAVDSKKPAVNTNIHRVATPGTTDLKVPAKPADGAKMVAKPAADAKASVEASAKLKPAPIGSVAQAPTTTVPASGTAAPKATN